MDIIGIGDVSLAGAIDSEGVFDAWVPLIEPITVSPSNIISEI
jgi:hypothetical protein